MIEKAINICRVLLDKNKNNSTKDINMSIDEVLKIFPSLLDQKDIILKNLESIYSVFSDNYKILDEDINTWLKDRKANIEWKFWNRYLNYLNNKVAPDTVNKLDNLTDDILDRIINPEKPGKADKRGMVVGQVQSGKTSNYIGLINKAADSGYKLIIVLAGMHDSLRSQTQIRIDEGFLGFNSQRSLQYSNTNKIGVGLYNFDIKTKTTFELPATSLTSSHLNGDFNRRVAQSAAIHLRSSDPLVAVVKKNVSILKNLISWLATWGDKQSDNKIIVRNVPFLLIDDEADNASINVSREKVSAINGCIRALLSLFEQSSYVGYTATPFANIFIPILNEASVNGIDLSIRDYEYSVGQDLFPKNFIINLPAPSNYVGPTKIFGLPSFTSSETEEYPLPLIIDINDYNSLIPDKHRSNDALPTEIPVSLKYAIKCFILTTAARICRNQINVHNSMLVHVTRFVRWQDRIATLIDNELKFYQRQIEMNTGFLIKELEEIWENEFSKISEQIKNNQQIYIDHGILLLKWKEVKENIYPAITKMEVRAVHGDRNISGLTYHNISPLDYFFSEQQGKFLSVIAVGGDKLSRGLTLEGLTISYYLRASKMYDTLMQMGRWFGYKPGYVDLCRIFTSSELISWYKHITIASEEMRKDFDYMFLLNKTPKDFGLKVRTGPKGLKITSINKFRYHKLMYLSYSGELEQTYQFTLDKNKLKNNFDATIDLISKLGKTIQPMNKFNPQQKFVWKSDNNSNLIISFLTKYQADIDVIDTNKMIDYIIEQNKNGILVNWTVAVINNSTAENENKFIFDGLTEKIGLIDRTNISKDSSIYEVTNYNITDGLHELIDLSEDEISFALEETIKDFENKNKDNINKKEKPSNPSRVRIKSVRKSSNGLLLIYPLNHNCLFKDNISNEKTRKQINDFPVIGIAVSFPEIENDNKIEYAVNEQFNNEYEYPEEIDFEEINNGTN